MTQNTTLRTLSDRELREIEMAATYEAVRDARSRTKQGPIKSNERCLWRETTGN